MRLAAACALAASLFAMTPRATAQETPPVVIVTVPGITWHDIRTADTPVLDELIDGGAVAALATRTAVGRPNPDRGYMTLGAGNRALLGPRGRQAEPYEPDPQAQTAFIASDPVEDGTAIEALRRRVGDAPNGQVVHLGIAYLQARQAESLYDARIGALGDALRDAHVSRGVVSAADLAPAPDTSSFRRSSVLAVTDTDGTVDAGVLHGLVVRDERAPFGVRTDPVRFATAVRETVRRSRVVVAEPGETLRADEFAAVVATGAVAAMRRRALERTDEVIGAVKAGLPANATLIVLAPSPPSHRLAPDHLTPIVATGPGMERGWLTSPTTRRAGQVTLTDVAPTVLAAVRAPVPDGFTGRAMSSVPYGGGDRIAQLDALDRASVFRESFAALVFWITAALISVLLIAAAALFWRRRTAAYAPLVAVAYFALAIFPAAHLLRTFDYWRIGHVGAHAALYAIAAVLAFAASRIPGPRLAGAVALLLVSAANLAVDALATGPLQVNGVWGHSPVVAGRFYGFSNVGSTILFCSSVLGLTGLAQLRRERTAPLWMGAVLAAVVAVDGLAQFGSDFGGLITGVIAIGVVMRLARGRRIDWRWLAAVCVVAIALTAAVTVLDLLRAPHAQTHFGRFAGVLRTGGSSAVGLIVKRKIAAQFGSLGTTPFAYFVPIGIALLALALAVPRGVLRDVLEDRPLVRAGLWGVVVVGAVGFAVNDSGISITATALAHAVPVLVLLLTDRLGPRKRALDAARRT